METAVLPEGFEEIRREELARAFQKVLRLRYFVLPASVLIVLYIALTDSSWYRAAAFGTALVAVAITLFEIRRMRKHGIARFKQSSRDFLAIVIGLPLVTLFTGGLRSPFTIQLLPVLVIVAILRGRRPALITLGCFLAFLWVLILIRPVAPWLPPPVFLDPSGRLSATYDVVFVATTSVLAVGVCGMGIALRSMSDSMLLRSLEARGEALKLHAERLNDLTTLSGEIAHELKNPLASIKGLAQLMEVEPARAQERLKILQHEVDRMRGILDEFLNFSRPLVPLAQEPVDLGDLCRSVVALHEGVAGARHLMLVAPAEQGVQLRCDRRKTIQILVNLVQNAVEASPEGGEVRVAIDRNDGFACIRVMDRGAGLSQGLQERAFAAGVTSKPGGSGLGLTIVRSLAEQHGGSVRLSNRDGGGCVAEVLLPMAGAVVPARGMAT